MLNSNVLL